MALNDINTELAKPNTPLEEREERIIAVVALKQMVRKGATADVQDIAMKVLITIASRCTHESALEDTLKHVVRHVYKGTDSARALCCLALKGIVSNLSESSFGTVLARTCDTLLAIVQQETKEPGVSVEKIVDVLDVLEGIFSELGSSLTQLHTLALEVFIALFDHASRLIVKGAIRCFGALAQVIDFSECRTFVLQSLETFDQRASLALLDAYGTVARSAGSRFDGGLVSKMIAELCSFSNDPERIEDCELREGALLVIEAMLQQCDSASTIPHLPMLVPVLCKALKYDPNVVVGAMDDNDDEDLMAHLDFDNGDDNVDAAADDDDDDWGAGDEGDYAAAAAADGDDDGWGADDDDDDDDEHGDGLGDSDQMSAPEFSEDDEADVSDDEDSSWHVRRGASKCLHALISLLISNVSSSKPNSLGSITAKNMLNELASTVVERFDERQEHIKLEVLTAFHQMLFLCTKTKLAPSAFVAPHFASLLRSLQNTLVPQTKARAGASSVIISLKEQAAKVLALLLQAAPIDRMLSSTNVCSIVECVCSFVEQQAVVSQNAGAHFAGHDVTAHVVACGKQLLRRSYNAEAEFLAALPRDAMQTIDTALKLAISTAHAPTVTQCFRVYEEISKLMCWAFQNSQESHSDDFISRTANSAQTEVDSMCGIDSSSTYRTSDAKDHALSEWRASSHVLDCQRDTTMADQKADTWTPMLPDRKWICSMIRSARSAARQAVQDSSQDVRARSSSMSFLGLSHALFGTLTDSEARDSLSEHATLLEFLSSMLQHALIRAQTLKTIARVCHVPLVSRVSLTLESVCKTLPDAQLSMHLDTLVSTSVSCTQYLKHTDHIVQRHAFAAVSASIAMLDRMHRSWIIEKVATIGEYIPTQSSLLKVVSSLSSCLSEDAATMSPQQLDIALLVLSGVLETVGSCTVSLWSYMPQVLELCASSPHSSHGSARQHICTLAKHSFVPAVEMFSHMMQQMSAKKHLSMYADCAASLCHAVPSLMESVQGKCIAYIEGSRSKLSLFGVNADEPESEEVKAMPIVVALLGKLGRQGLIDPEAGEALHKLSLSGCSQKSSDSKSQLQSHSAPSLLRQPSDHTVFAAVASGDDVQVVEAARAFGAVCIGNFDQYWDTLAAPILLDPSDGRADIVAQFASLHGLYTMLRAPSTVMRQKKQQIESLVPGIIAMVCAHHEKSDIANLAVKVLGRLVFFIPGTALVSLASCMEQHSSEHEPFARADGTPIMSSPLCVFVRALDYFLSHAFAYVRADDVTYDVQSALARGLKIAFKLLQLQTARIPVLLSTLLLLRNAIETVPNIASALALEHLPHVSQLVIQRRDAHRCIVDFGPYKQTVDRGAEVRKNALQCVSTLLRHCVLDEKEIASALDATTAGVQDPEFDVRLYAHSVALQLVATNRCVHDGVTVLIEAVQASAVEQAKSNLVQQEREAFEEMQESAKACIESLKSMGVSTIL
jgi:TATA-binding protein interacting (TIP20)